MKSVLQDAWMSLAISNLLATLNLFGMVVELVSDLRFNPRPFRFEAADPRTPSLLYVHGLCTLYILVTVAGIVSYRRDAALDCSPCSLFASSFPVAAQVVGVASNQRSCASCRGGVLELATDILHTLGARPCGPDNFIFFSGRPKEMNARATWKLSQGRKSQKRSWMTGRAAPCACLPASAIGSSV